MIIGILKEQGDKRVAMTPQAISKISSENVKFWVEKGAGETAYYSDSDYADQAEIKSREEILAKSDLTIFINPISDEELGKMKKESAVVSQFAPFADDKITSKLKNHGLTAFSLDMIPRTTLAQSMDVLSSMASIAGYKAVLEAAMHLPRYFPMMMTAAGSVRPAKIIVLGAGVAGLAAIATARRLGAVVEANDTRLAAKEEVESLGAKFIMVEGAKDDVGAGGYAVAQSDEFLQKQRELVQEKVSQADVVITTAQVRGRKAPILLPNDTVEKMKPGAVIVDLASSTGGNCELSKDNDVVVHNNVIIIGNSALASKMPQDASHLYGNNLVNYLKVLIKDEALNLDMENEIISGSLITKEA
jgi:NAD(P) transhydrogenase subunit alpha